MKNLIQIILLILFTTILLNQDLLSQCTIEGKVTDDSGEELIAANIEVFRDGVFVTGLDTDINGNYVISGLEAGTYDIQYSYVGYSTQKIEGVVLNQNITLNKGMIESMGLICISTLCFSSPLLDDFGGNKIYTAKDIRRMAIK